MLPKKSGAKKAAAKKAAAKTTATTGKMEEPESSAAERRQIRRRRSDPRDSDADVAGNGFTHGDLVILTGMSGAGKASALKAFEDLGFYSVDNLPLELIPRFADLVRQSTEIDHAALVIDVREGIRLERFPAILKKVRKVLHTRVVFLEATEESLVRRFSETRRPHPMGARRNGDRIDSCGA